MHGLHGRARDLPEAARRPRTRMTNSPVWSICVLFADAPIEPPFAVSCTAGALVVVACPPSARIAANSQLLSHSLITTLASCRMNSGITQGCLSRRTRAAFLLCNNCHSH
jgi:hypothetical protein